MELTRLKESNFANTDKDFNRRILTIKAHCRGEKLLEIGSSWGYFLYQAKRHGYEAAGIEIGERRRNFGVKQLGVDIFSGFGALPKQTYDIVYSSHVLEHFADLSTFFSSINSCLRVGGSLLIEVPNFDFRALGAKTLSIIGAVHPLGFSSEFFSRNLTKYGFRIAGFYDSWVAFPTMARERSTGDVIIVYAEKVRA